MSSLLTLPSLTIQNLSKKFGEQFAVKDANWHAERGQIVCLLGHSGCGKTTMLRLIAGLESPTSGSIELEQKILWNTQQQIPAENRNIGLVFQDYALFPHLTVFENVKFGLMHLSKQQQKQITEDALIHVSLSQHMDKYPHMLSGGEQQRVALARALAPKPDVLLMDEPFSNLDRRLRDRIRQNTIDILRKTGTTTIIVTHDPEEALQIADQIILMHQGQIIQIGRPQQLYQNPNSLFSAEYFSTLNKVSCTLQGNILKSSCEQLIFYPESFVDFTPMNELNTYWCCFRPHHVELHTAWQEEFIPVQVLSINYLGHQQSLQLRVEHSDQIIHAQGAFNFAPQIGQQLFANIHDRQSFMFPEHSEQINLHS